MIRQHTMTLKQIKEIATISDGNRKLGVIPSLSLPPVLTCMKDAPCIKECYAMKAWRLYPSVRSAYTKNLDSFNADPIRFRNALWNWLDKKYPKHFRFNVSGDIPNAAYRGMIIETASMFSEIRFLAFTKRYELFRSENLNMPDNLTVIFSAWPGFPLPNQNRYPVAYMQDGNETRVDGSEIECPGNCETCGMCWQLPKIGKNVVFMKH